MCPLHAQPICGPPTLSTRFCSMGGSHIFKKNKADLPRSPGMHSALTFYLSLSSAFEHHFTPSVSPCEPAASSPRGVCGTMQKNAAEPHHSAAPPALCRAACLLLCSFSVLLHHSAREACWQHHTEVGRRTTVFNGTPQLKIELGQREGNHR